MEPLDAWLDRQQRCAAAGMRMSVSPVAIVKTRPGFGQTVHPRKGAIVASPVLAAYDPDPDYFFHWYRDSAAVIDALRLLFEGGGIGPEALTHLADFVEFSLSLQQLDGRALVAAPSWRTQVAADFTRYLRSDEELAAVHGDAVAGETRVNPDATRDISRWARPQHDGPPLRALMLLRWLRGTALDGALAQRVGALVRADLAFTLRHWPEPSFDIWEEERGLHYYTLRVAGAALDEGAAWLDSLGDAQQARSCRTQAQAIFGLLDGYWLADEAHYRSRVLADGARSAKELDIAVILAAVHTAGTGAHSAQDPRMHATLARLEALFDAAYPINRNRSERLGPAMGRYAGDIYYSGGAYYFSTLGAAEFCFHAAQGCADAQAWIGRGDAYLETVRAFTPPSGALSEQFDQRTGEQTSARHLAWSYAAFISCVAARRAVVGRS
jgi:glucoamylase